MVEEKKEIRVFDIEIPEGVNLEINSKDIILKKGENNFKVSYNPVYSKLEKKDNLLKCIPKSKKKKYFAITKTLSKLIINALAGFNKTFEYKLAIVYSHFPMNVKTESDKIIITNFLGEKKPRITRLMPGVKVNIKGKEIIVSGNNKYNVGQTAGNIENATRIKNKDYRVFDDGCYIIEKDK